MSQDPQTILWWQYLIEKILSWPFLVLIIFFILLRPLKKLVNRAAQIKVGNFQISVNEIAESLGIANVIKDLQDLSYDELKIFLVIGGEDANYYKFCPNNLPQNKVNEFYNKFSKKGLIEFVDPKTIDGISEIEKQEGKGYRTTDKGEKVHRAILDAIYRDLIQIKANNK